MASRAAKNNAIKAIRNSNDDAETEDILTVEGISAVSDDDVGKGKPFTIPVVSQNAREGFSLDLFKQYKRKIDFCDRDIMRIHDKSVNKKDQGSDDKGLIYVDFNAGIFEAFKVNVMKCLENDFKTKPIADPKVEYYGAAQERICLDLQMTVGDKKHDVKIKVHNTKCSLDVQGFHDAKSKRFEHLFDLTVGEYFANHVITKIVARINSSFDISKLNTLLRSLATDGKNAAKAKPTKKQCKLCEKDTKNLKTLLCSCCKETTHYICLPTLTDENKEVKKLNGDFQCGNCILVQRRK